MCGVQVAGSCAGACSVVVGQPFDTIKVRLQATSIQSRASAMQVAMSTIKQEGVSALFKGMGAPVGESFARKHCPPQLDFQAGMFAERSQMPVAQE